jgi:hypothetical protein
VYFAGPGSCWALCFLQNCALGLGRNVVAGVPRVDGVVRTLVLLAIFVPCAGASQQTSSAGSASSKSSAAKVSTAKSKVSGKKQARGQASGSRPKTTSTVASDGAYPISGKHSSSRRKKSSRVRGQKKIESERARAIQEALIREHYLNGEAMGAWNQASEDAMRRYQGDHGWQTKTVPDSRALIKLGLGPSKDHLLNPESAMTTVPDSPQATSLNPASHSAAAAAPLSKTPTSDPVPAATSQQNASGPQ